MCKEPTLTTAGTCSATGITTLNSFNWTQSFEELGTCELADVDADPDDVPRSCDAVYGDNGTFAVTAGICRWDNLTAAECGTAGGTDKTIGTCTETDLTLADATKVDLSSGTCVAKTGETDKTFTATEAKCTYANGITNAQCGTGAWSELVSANPGSLAEEAKGICVADTDIDAEDDESSVTCSVGETFVVTTPSPDGIVDDKGICVADTDIDAEDDESSVTCSVGETFVETTPAVPAVPPTDATGSCVVTTAGASTATSCSAIGGVSGTHAYTKATCEWVGVSDSDCGVALTSTSTVCDLGIASAPFDNTACLDSGTGKQGTFIAEKGTCTWTGVTETTCTSAPINASLSDWTTSGTKVCEVQFP